MEHIYFWVEMFPYHLDSLTPITVFVVRGSDKAGENREESPESDKQLRTKLPGGITETRVQLPFIHFQ